MLEVQKFISSLPENVKNQYNAKVRNLENLSKRTPITEPVQELITREIAAFKRIVAEYHDKATSSTALGQSDDFSNYLGAIDPAKYRLNDTVFNEVREYADNILSTLMDSKFGKLIVIKIGNIMLRTNDFSDKIRFIGKVEESELGLSKESLLYFIDIAACNFEYFDYSKWAKVSDQELEHLRIEASKLSLDILYKAKSFCGEITRSEFDKFNKKLSKNKAAMKWLPPKRVERLAQEAGDLEIARDSIYDTLCYYLDQIKKTQHKIRSDAQIVDLDQLNRTIIYSVTQIKMIMLNNPEHMMGILQDSSDDFKYILSSLYSMLPDADELIPIFIRLTAKVIAQEQNSFVKQAMMSCLRSFNNISRFFPRENEEDLLFLSKFMHEFFLPFELKNIKPQLLEYFSQNTLVIKMLPFFKDRSYRDIIINLYNTDQTKLKSIFDRQTFVCLSTNRVSVGILLEWPSHKIKSIVPILATIKKPQGNDVYKLSRLFNENQEDFQVKLNSTVIEALQCGYCTLSEALSVNNEARRAVIFSNRVMKACRLECLKIPDLLLLNINDLRKLTSHNAILAMEKGGANFQELFKLLRDDPEKFKFITSADSGMKYVEGKSFADQCQRYESSKSYKRINSTPAKGMVR